MARKTLAGFKREKGGARGYIETATGKRYSRRQYEKLQAERVGGRQAMSPQRIARQTRAQRNYNQLLKRYVENKRSEGEKINKTEARKSRKMKEIVRALNKSGEPGGGVYKLWALDQLGYNTSAERYTPLLGDIDREDIVNADYADLAEYAEAEADEE